MAAALAAMKANRPLLVEEICREFLDLKPGSVEHIRLLGLALIKQKRLSEAEDRFRFALKLKPDYPQLHADLGMALAHQGQLQEAIPCLQKAIQLDPLLTKAHKKLGQVLAAVGRGEEADEAFSVFFEQAPGKTHLAEGAEHMRAGRVNEAIDVFRAVLKSDPDDVDAMRYLAVAWAQEEERYDDAEALLRRTVKLAPDFALAWQNLGYVLVSQSKYLEAVDSYRQATRLEPENAGAWGNLGNAFALAGKVDDSSAAFARSVALNPKAPGVQMGHAHVLKTLGSQEESLESYRAAIRTKPDFGEVYWSMANLKVFQFQPAEVQAMEEQLARDDLTASAEIHFRFALGKAYEDLKDYDKAWNYYHTGNQLQRQQVYHDPQEMHARHQDIFETFSAEFLSGQSGHGCEAPDPIFIVGLPRSGSTLVEQILSSHPMVEGTAELPNLSKIATTIGRYRSDGLRYPLAARKLAPRDWLAYGQQYIDETRRHRVLGKPFFTDKLPNNFPQIGFAHLALPNAKIINTRRHPLDSCLGAYKQLFGKGQNFTYDIDDLADYYRAYCDMMDHWQAVLPEKVLDVHYEDTVLKLEEQVHRILDHCGLPFDEACLKFYENPRAVRTASSEQVRQPIYTGSLGKWRKYEAHLDEWKKSLGDIIERLPEYIQNAGA
ncbi:MAG TPA: sulfotransferase [Xanthomonadales bacterium]|nr:sulfotransferase [Xanthomonadales bacterium]